MATYEIPYAELYSAAFIQQQTRFDSVQQMFDACGLQFGSAEEYKLIPVERFDALVSAETPFDSWKEFTSAATANWIRQRMQR